MQRIPLSEIRRIEDVYKYSFHDARWNGNEQPLDVFVRDSNEWFYWNTWRSSKDDFSRNYIFALIDFYQEVDTWLLAEFTR